MQLKRSLCMYDFENTEFFIKIKLNLHLKSGIVRKTIMKITFIVGVVINISKCDINHI